MNVLRRMNKNQQHYMEMICSGKWVIKWDPDHEAYALGVGEKYALTVPKRKLWFRQLYRCSMRDPWPTLVLEWQIRGLLIDVDGRLMPSKDVIRAFGAPPPEPMPPKAKPKMSRTRAARAQA
jgi:hypothetical protein